MTTITAVQSGNWFTPATWGGVLPVMDDDVDLGGFTVELTDDDIPAVASISNGTLVAPAGTTRLLPAMPLDGVTLGGDGTWRPVDASTSNPGITNVKQGVAYRIADMEKVGTLQVGGGGGGGSGNRGTVFDPVADPVLV